MITLAKQLNGYRLTTAEIVYHLPDYSELLQYFIWQDFDVVPGFPVLKRFLRFWHQNLDGRLHSVTVAAASRVQPPRIMDFDGPPTLH